jgi:hypothetical protein
VFSLFWEVQISLYLQQEIRSSSRGVSPKERYIDLETCEFRANGSYDGINSCNNYCLGLCC